MPAILYSNCIDDISILCTSNLVVMAVDKIIFLGGQAMNENNLTKSIKEEMERYINVEYTKAKEKLLNDMDATLELKRNEIVKELLNTISIECSQENPAHLPEINIKISRW